MSKYALLTRVPKPHVVVECALTPISTNNGCTHERVAATGRCAKSFFEVSRAVSDFLLVGHLWWLTVENVGAAGLASAAS
jgi:hypothetical protein